jgi:hypothetical protein
MHRRNFLTLSGLAGFATLLAIGEEFQHRGLRSTAGGPRVEREALKDNREQSTWLISRLLGSDACRSLPSDGRGQSALRVPNGEGAENRNLRISQCS